jgi:hypothetical protein
MFCITLHNDYANGGAGNATLLNHQGIPLRIMQNKIAFMQFYAKLCIFMQKSYAKSCSLALF